MKARLRSIERALVRQRAERAVHEFVDDLAERWPQVADPHADIHLVVDLVNQLWDPNGGLHTMPAAIAHLESCREEASSPTPAPSSPSWPPGPSGPRGEPIAATPESLTSVMAPWTVRPAR